MSLPRKRYPRITPVVASRQSSAYSSDRYSAALKNQEFARRLEGFMAAKKMTQSDLALACFGTRKDKYGVVQTAGRDRISAYINGRQFPDEINLMRLAKALDVTEEELTPDMDKITEEIEAETTAPEFDIKQIPNSSDVWFDMHKRMTLDLAYQIIGLMVSQPEKLTGNTDQLEWRTNNIVCRHYDQAEQDRQGAENEQWPADDPLDLANHLAST